MAVPIRNKYIVGFRKAVLYLERDPLVTEGRSSSLSNSAYLFERAMNIAPRAIQTYNQTETGTSMATAPDKTLNTNPEEIASTSKTMKDRKKKEYINIRKK